MDILFYSFAVSLFAAIILLIEGVYLWWSSTRGGQARRIARRLQMMSSDRHRTREPLSILKQRALSGSPLLARLLARTPYVARLDTFLIQAGLKWTVAQFIGMTLAAAGAGLVLGWHFHLQSTLIPGLLCALLPYLWVRRARLRRLKKIEAQLPEAADLISRSLRAGHAFSSALQMAGEEMPEPIAGEFRIVFDEVNFGVALADALQSLAVRIPLGDFRYLVIAVLIQKESGGNLTEVLDNISRVIRARLNLLGDIRVLSAEGTMSAWILGLLPFAVGLMIAMANPAYLKVLWTDPAGLKLIWGCVIMSALGALWMRRIIRIRV
jgi:tight adherence protein B